MPNEFYQSTGVFPAGTLARGSEVKAQFDAVEAGFDMIGSDGGVSSIQGGVNVKWFGAQGNGVAIDTAAFVAAYAALFDLGGGVLFVPPGIYLIDAPIAVIDYTILRGVWGKSVMRATGAGAQMLFNPAQADGDILSYIGIDGMAFDGNKSGTTNTFAGVALNGITRCFVRDSLFYNAPAYGLGFQATPGALNGITGEQTDIYISNSHFYDNGEGGSFDGLDIKYCQRVTLVGCTARNNAENGFDVRGQQIALIGCTARDNGLDGVQLKANHAGEDLYSAISLSGVTSRGNGSNGILIGSGVTGGVGKCRVTATGIHAHNNGTNGVLLHSHIDQTEVTGGQWNLASNGNSGVFIDGSLSNSADSCVLTGIISRANSRSGITVGGNNVTVSDSQFAQNTLAGIEEKSNSTTGNEYTNCLLPGNGTPVIRSSANSRFSGCTVGNITATETINSFSFTSLPEVGRTFLITGNATIPMINPSWRDREVVLVFDGTALIQSNSTVRLAGNFQAQPNATLTLVSVDNVWYERSRSLNNWV